MVRRQRTLRTRNSRERSAERRAEKYHRPGRPDALEHRGWGGHLQPSRFGDVGRGAHHEGLPEHLVSGPTDPAGGLIRVADRGSLR